jgi:hypothetical protein
MMAKGENLDRTINEDCRQLDWTSESLMLRGWNFVADISASLRFRCPSHPVAWVF